MNEDPYSLDKLHDLVMPERVSWWPLAPGWWLLLGLVVLWVAAFVIIRSLRRRANAYRGAGLHQLARIESLAKATDNRAAAVVELSALLKRVALAAYSRDAVASLSGAEWLAFLDRTSSASSFASRPANVLATASSDSSEAASLSATQFEELCQTARLWIETHQPEVEAC